MKRRRVLLGAASFLLLPACETPAPPPRFPPQPLSRSASIAAWRGRVRSILDRGGLPIIDTEATLNVKRFDVQYMLREMAANDVAQIALAPLMDPFDGSIDSLRLHQSYPAWFIPTTADGVTRAWFGSAPQRADFVRQVEGEIRERRYFFMGEHEIRHYMSSDQVRQGLVFRDVTIPIDDPHVQRIFRLSEQTGVAFQIHYEIEDALLPPLEATLQRFPGARVIWCHLGQIRYPERSSVYGPDYVQGLIARFPNLHFDLAVGGPGHIYPGSGARDSTILEFTGQPPFGGRLRPAWREVIERHPEHFLAASDVDAGEEYRNYTNKIRRVRELILNELSERARHLVAYRNAWRLITGSPWPG